MHFLDGLFPENPDDQPPRDIVPRQPITIKALAALDRAAAADEITLRADPQPTQDAEGRPLGMQQGVSETFTMATPIIAAAAVRHLMPVEEARTRFPHVDFIEPRRTP